MARISALALDLLSPAATLDFCRSAAVADATASPAAAAAAVLAAIGEAVSS